MKKTLAGDLDRTIMMKAPVTEVTLSQLPTIIFLSIAVELAIFLAAPLAFFAASRVYSATDIAIRSVRQVGLSLPVFPIGLLRLTLLAAQLVRRRGAMASPAAHAPIQ